MAKQVKTIPYTFNENFEECKTLFRNAGFDVSDGSNTAQLSAVLSYLVSALNTNTALNINETLLPYATKRKNILQDARVLGYEATHKVSYQYKITILLDEKMQGYGSFTVPNYFCLNSSGKKYYVFSSLNTNLKINLGRLVFNSEEINPENLVFESNKVYYNNTDVTNLWTDVKNTFKENQKIELIVKEGELIKYDEDVSSLKRTIDSVTLNGLTYTRNYIDIPYTDVENDGIECFVSYYDDFNNYQEDVQFKRDSDYFFDKTYNITDSKKFIRLDDIEMGTPRVYFKYAGMGSGIPLGSKVKFNILTTSGTDGEMSVNYSADSENDYIVYTGIDIPELPSDNSEISNVFDNCTIIGVDLLKSGADEESNTSIKENAPKVYNSAYRLITNVDYQSACNQNTSVYDSVVWGGEDEYPKAPGHIWFSFLPSNFTDRDFTTNSDNSLFTRDNSKLVYNYAEGDTKYQYQLRQMFYRNNYILNTEIKSIQNNEYTGVFGELMKKSVPGLTFHHRHPLYLNFEYTFNILKYNIKESPSAIHKELFDVLDNCFYGEDSLNLENFGVDYFHSNIVKRLDSKITDLCGFTSYLETKIMLNEKTCTTENWDSQYKDIYIPLCVPFEKYFTSNGFLDTSRLPNIDTKNFIDFRFDEIVPPTSEYPYEGKVINKYSYLKYSIVSGDLYTDWSKIKSDQAYRKSLNTSNSNDRAVKMFVAPVKIKMNYKYYCSETFMNSNDNYFKLGFKLAPSNTHDELMDNIIVRIYNQNYQYGANNSSRLVRKIEDFDTYFTMGADRENIYFNQAFRDLLRTGYVIDVEFTRTCGFYYVFNSAKKEILVHLFVNGDYEGFEVAKNGMLSNEYYDHYLDELKQTWTKNEDKLTDDDMYLDITYTTPRSYLYTTDKKYLVTAEPTGTELEAEKHLFNYDQYGLPSETADNREDESGTEYGHYLTTEGYISDGNDTDTYTGPIVRAYNENMYLYTPLTLDLFKQNVYMNLKYPSNNFKVHKNLIPRLNSVKFKNAVELY